MSSEAGRRVCSLLEVMIISPGEHSDESGASKEDILSLATKYAEKLEPKLDDKDRDAVATIKKTVEQNRFSELFLKEAISGLLSSLTLNLSTGKSFDGLTVATAYLFTEVPKNRRAANLFGSALNAIEEYEDAVTVFQYTLSLDEKNVLTKLNLAISLLDADRDEEAFPILNQLELFEDRDNKAVYRALAAYYFKKDNLGEFREYLLKAAKFKGFKRKKIDKKKEEVEKDKVEAGESPESAEAKLKRLEGTIPMTTADIIEGDYPEEAARIRERYGRLKENEKCYMPKLPGVGTANIEVYTKNRPVLREWGNSMARKLKAMAKADASHYGIDPKASKKMQQAQAKKAAMEQFATMMQNAMEGMKFIQNMPGMSPDMMGKMGQAQRQMEELAMVKNVPFDDRPADPERIPGLDCTSDLTRENHRNLQAIYTSYLNYFTKFWMEYDMKIMEIQRVYTQKVDEENSAWEVESERLSKAHDDAVASGSHSHDPPDQTCRQPHIDHLKRLNEIGNSSFGQWSSLFFPYYISRMKPMLDGFYNVCMLHVRNMGDPELMRQEHSKVLGTYSAFAGRAISGIGVGEMFGYYPETEELQRELNEELAKAKEEAERKKPEFERSFPTPEFSIVDWIDDHFVLEISGELLALKISPKEIEFEASLIFVQAGAKYEFSEEKFETYTSVGMKLDFGINVCGSEVGVEAKGEALKRTATWDLKEGKYSESTSAKAEVMVEAGPVLKLGGEVELDTQLNAKVTGKAQFMNAATFQAETEF